MLSFLQWFDDNPARYWWLVCLVLCIVSFVAVRPLLRKPTLADQKKSDWIWGWAILAVMLAGRWPTFFITFEFNPDESQLIAGASSLRHDLVFWRSVDGSTAGPLDFYALLPVGSLTGHDNFFSARLTALLLIATALLFVHQSSTLVFGRAASRIGGLAVLFFESLTTHTDFLHYSTELVPVSLLATGYYLGLKQLLTGSADRKGQFLLGLVLGAAPFAKLQSAPIAATLWLAFFTAEILAQKPPRSLPRHWPALAAGSLTPCVLLSAMTVITSEWTNAVTPYILNNILYVGESRLTLMKSAVEIFSAVTSPGSIIHVWLLTGVGMLLLLFGIKRPWPSAARRFGIITLVFLIVSWCSILTPRRAFAHYLQLMVVPWALLLSVVSGLAWQAWRDRRDFIGIVLLSCTLSAGSVGIIYCRAQVEHPHVGLLSLSDAQPIGQIGKMILLYAQPPEAVAIWGWKPKLYIETGLPQATREAVTLYEIVPGPYQCFFRERYLADLRKSSPPVFVDTTGGQSPFISILADRKFSAHDYNFPELADFIHLSYTEVASLYGTRIYVRNDRLSLPLSSQTGQSEAISHQ